MEKRLNKKIEVYITSFKNEIKDKITSLTFQDKEKINDLLEFVYDYNRLILEKDDFAKRKRVKNSIPNINRCIAKRANGEQCTRRRKDDCEFCGTHSKGIPHGSMQTNENEPNINIQSLEVTAEDIKGIIYYIDKFNNVYKTEDILEGNENPQVIATAVKVGNILTIPELGI